MARWLAEIQGVPSLCSSPPGDWLASLRDGDLPFNDVDLSCLVGEIDDEKQIALDEALVVLAEQDPP